jgi:hypothetical protein
VDQFGDIPDHSLWPLRRLRWNSLFSDDLPVSLGHCTRDLGTTEINAGIQRSHSLLAFGRFPGAAAIVAALAHVSFPRHLPAGRLLCLAVRSPLL